MIDAMRLLRIQLVNELHADLESIRETKVEEDVGACNCPD
jgi:hypothetical protein